MPEHGRARAALAKALGKAQDAPAEIKAPPVVEAAQGVIDEDQRPADVEKDTAPREPGKGSPRFGASVEEWLHFDLVLGLSDDLLPVVANPNAKKAAASKVQESGKVPTVYDGKREFWGIGEWTSKIPTPAELRMWQNEPDYGICLQTRVVRALDVDVTDPTIAAEIEAFVDECLSRVLPTRRRSNSSKFLKAFILKGEFKKRNIVVVPKADSIAAQRIEFLANGQQFVAAGTHPSGARIQWNGGLPQDFPILTVDEFEALWAALGERFGADNSPAAPGVGPGTAMVVGRFAEGGRDNALTSEAGKLRRIGHSPEGIEAALQIMNHERCDPPLPEEQVTKIARSIGKKPLPPVVNLDLRLANNGSGIPDEENVRRIIAGDEELVGLVRFDEFRGERILARPMPDGSGVVGESGVPRPWTDADTVALQVYIQRRYMPRIGRERIEGPIDLYARRYASFHPIRDYLQSVKWDRVPRLDTWLRDYLGATVEPSDYLAAVGACFLKAAVARVMEPGCQVDSALVLEGAQGIFKSTALRSLAGDRYFSDSLPADLAAKDARDHLRGKWIIELSELAQFKKSDIETLKAFLSRRVEQYRPSYGRNEVSVPRQCVFAGSTNNSEYLVDSTGNRRFWVVSCGQIDIDGIRRDRDQLWAEALVRYRAGEAWHLTGSVAKIAAAQAQERVAHDPWTEDVATALEWLPPGDVTPGEVLKKMDVATIGRNEHAARRVAKILIELGWKRGARHKTRGQLFRAPNASG